MKKRIKIISFLTLIISFMSSCSDQKFIKNKILIKSFSLSKLSSCKSSLRFSVEYYSDSTNSNLYSSSIERGQDGINETIYFFGSKNHDSLKKCKCSSFEEIKTMINAKDRRFRGERLEKELVVCTSESNEYFLVIRNENNSLDTIFAEYPPPLVRGVP